MAPSWMNNRRIIYVIDQIYTGKYFPFDVLGEDI